MSTCKCKKSCDKSVSDYIRTCSLYEKIAETGKKTKINKNNACPSLDDIADDFDITEDAFDSISSWQDEIPNLDDLFDNDFSDISIDDFEVPNGHHFDDINIDFDFDHPNEDWHIWESHEVTEEISNDVTHPEIDDTIWEDIENDDQNDDDEDFPAGNGGDNNNNDTPTNGGSSCDNQAIEDAGIICLRAKNFNAKRLGLKELKSSKRKPSKGGNVSRFYRQAFNHISKLGTAKTRKAYNKALADYASFVDGWKAKNSNQKLSIPTAPEFKAKDCDRVKAQR